MGVELRYKEGVARDLAPRQSAPRYIYQCLTHLGLTKPSLQHLCFHKDFKVNLVDFVIDCLS
jgi:hypothetical protein